MNTAITAPRRLLGLVINAGGLAVGIAHGLSLLR
ncbi:hypothetical protein ABIC63_004984 [Pseudacidovorax sp. 1753]